MIEVLARVGPIPCNPTALRTSACDGECRFVAPAGLTDRLLLRELVDPEQEPISSGAVFERAPRLGDIRA
jgi:hypothetical protein